jgi:hypothetical protein
MHMMMGGRGGHMMYGRGSIAAANAAAAAARAKEEATQRFKELLLDKGVSRGVMGGTSSREVDCLPEGCHLLVAIEI